MPPQIGQVAFTTGLIVFVLALLVLPSLEPDSPEFVADVLALIISGIFLVLVIISIRRAAWLPAIPPPTDEHTSDQGNGQDE